MYPNRRVLTGYTGFVHTVFIGAVHWRGAVTDLCHSCVSMLVMGSTRPGSVRMAPPPPDPRECGSFAVIDLETTGLSAQRSDRIVEIAVVLTDGSGTIDYEWTTLVDPGRDVGPTHIHGITTEMISDAPGFGDIADDLARLITGRTIVAHNARFDLSFLHSEWNRLGQDLRAHSFCTMSAARDAGLPGGLSACCGHLGIPTGDAHRALDDARSANGLLARLGPPSNRISNDRRGRSTVTPIHDVPWTGIGLPR